MSTKKKINILASRKRHKSIVRLIGASINPLTNFEIARMLNALPHWTSGRITELKYWGIVEIMGYTINVQTKKRVACYTLTKYGQQILGGF